ncbi:MAG TPA: hypothetical protein VGF99_01230, partial [Myxococcota bacterium]
MPLPALARLLRAFFFFVVVVFFAPATRAAAFDRASWKADYAALKTSLERDYAHLAWFASPEGGVDLPALDRRTSAALQAA